jgi:hypothetical protein
VIFTSCQLAAFHAALTWLTFRVFDLQAAYLCSMFSVGAVYKPPLTPQALGAVVPLVAPVWVAVPACLALWARGQPLGAVIFLALHVLGWSADSILYAVRQHGVALCLCLLCACGRPG